MVKEKIAKLINVKSIITIVLVVVFATLALTERISGTEFMTIFTMVISFYFGTQSEKNATASTASTATTSAVSEKKGSE